ncbi:hypothetical protein [Priestia megaterium]|uniref:hypothetical protein n=1 Tax=Priestia megaterium TaxID=1404 RepID=UPI000BFBC03A|nr:hypothetical protein [Priestia megaterium]PGQ88183.1 hypothetical protein COA18_04465 [Priestia megaterium]
MSWQVTEYMDENPQASIKDIVTHLAITLDIDKQIDSVKNEVERVVLLRDQLRPLYGKKMEAERKIVILNSDFEMDVMIKYPKGKGSQQERKEYKAQLQSDSEDYQEQLLIIEKTKDQIELLEDEKYEVEQRAKNGRSLTNLFKEALSFIRECQELKTSLEKETNQNIF